MAEVSEYRLKGILHKKTSIIDFELPQSFTLSREHWECRLKGIDLRLKKGVEIEGYVKVQVNLTDDLANDSRGMLYTKVDTSRGELCNVALLHGKRTWYYIRTNQSFVPVEFYHRTLTIRMDIDNPKDENRDWMLKEDREMVLGKNIGRINLVFQMRKIQDNVAVAAAGAMKYSKY